MTAPQRTTRTLAAITVGLGLLGACGPTTPSDDEPICNDADKAVVDEIMDTARTNFPLGESTIGSFEFIEAATAPIPEQVQEFGASDLMVLLIAVNIDDPDIEEGFQGAQGPVYVVLDADGQPLGPLGTFSQNYFDLQPPDDPGWTEWADGVDDSDVAYDLFGCVNPNR